MRLKSGTYNIELIYQWTLAFKVGVIVSIVSLLILIIYWRKSSLKNFMRNNYKQNEFGVNIY